MFMASAGANERAKNKNHNPAEAMLSDLKESETFRYLSNKFELEELPKKYNAPKGSDLVHINNYMSSPVTARIIGPEGSNDHFAPNNIIIFTYHKPGQGKVEKTDFYYKILHEKSEKRN